MKSKRKFLIPALAVVLTAALAVGVFFFYKAFKKRINPEDQMIHNTQERIEYAQSCYKEFSKNPNKTYTVLVSLDSVTTEEFTQLFTGCGGFTQVYDCITEGVDDPMYGGYLDCEGKTAAQLAAECYADTYDSMYDETVEPFVTQPPVDTFGKDIDTSDIEVPGSSYSSDDTDFQLAEDLADLQEFHDNFVMLKQAMEQGRYRIYGVKLTLTGAQAQALLQSNKVRLVEKLTILPESSISPLDPSEENWD